MKSKAAGDAIWFIQPARTRSGRQLRSEEPTATVDGGRRNTEEEEEKVKEREEKEKAREPIFLVRWITDWPRLFFGLALGAHLFFVVLSGILYLSGYDILPGNWDAVPMELYDEPWLKREHAWSDRDDYPNRVSRDLHPEKYPTWDRAFTREEVVLFYNAGDGNIFTKERLQAMQTIEQRLASISEYSSYCQITESGTCTPFVSVLRFFDGTYSSVNAVFNDPNFDDIDNVLYAAYTNPETKGAFVFALGKKNNITSGSVSSTMTRSIVPLGWPLSAYDSEEAMETALTDYMADNMEPVLSGFEDKSEFEFTYYNYLLMFKMAKRQAMLDMALAAAAMLFIFSFMWFHTRSLMVTALAVMSIICSFVETNFVYRVIIDYRYFGYFHLLAMFIILGIGADDIFLFWDAWRATGLKQYSSLAHRLNETYRKASVTMLVTSLTTTAAFLANALSPLLATHSFGVFSAVLVMINYVSVVTFFPSVVIYYHLNYEDKPHPCCCCWKKDQKNHGDDEESQSTTETQSDPQVIAISHNNKNSTWKFVDRHTISGTGTTYSDNSDNEANASTEETVPRQKENPVIIFFRDYYFAVVTHKIIRWVIILVLLGIVAGFAYFAFQLEPDNEQMKFFRDFVVYTKAMDHNNYGFVANDQDRTTTIYLVWGLKENDLSDCHFSSIECKGEHSYDDSFDASTLAAQQSFVRICDAMFNFTDAQISDYAIRRDLTTGEPEIACFPRALQRFLQSDDALGSVDVTMPWDWAKTSDFMTALNTYYDTADFDSNFKRFLDIPMTYWIWHKFEQNNTADYQMYNSLFGEETGAYSSNILTNPFITTGNRIKYMAISVNTTLSARSLGYSEGIPIVERWENFMKEQMKMMPPEMQSGFQTTVYAWQWLYTQRTVSENAIQGIALGLSLSFPVLVLATCNIIIGLLATMSIACVTACVIGVVPMAGWKLGVLVSFNMCLLVGLAVDFVVHLAEGYHESKRRDRKGRVQDTLGRIGISVLAGACTTLGASFFMLFAKIQFFFQFGIFMISTIGFSLVFAMGLFIPVMGIIGPQGDVGDLRVLFRKCCACCRPKKKDARPPSTKNRNVVAPVENGSALSL